MAIIKKVRGYTPGFGKECWLADTAVIIGEVTMGDYCTVWFNAVLRGDVHSITIGDYTNIQDGAIIHGTYQKAKTIIGMNVSIAHGAVVHGCTIEDNVLIGIGAVVLDHAIVRKGTVVAAGAVVLPGTETEANSVYAGVPARKVKSTGPEMIEVIARTARNYPMYAGWYEEEK
jgi:gamma-carbonic anhydrase